MARRQKKSCQAIGFIFLSDRPHFTDPAQYREWLGYDWSPSELRADLHMGRLPEGVILQTADGPRVVIGRQGTYDQALVTFAEAMGERVGRADMVAMNLWQLKRLRQKLGMSQNELSNAIGISCATIGRIENGHYIRLTIETRAKLKAFFELHQEKLR